MALRSPRSSISTEWTSPSWCRIAAVMSWSSPLRSPPSTSNASCGAGPDGSRTAPLESLPGMKEGYQRSPGAASMIETEGAIERRLRGEPMLGTSEPRPENLHALGLAGWAVVLGLGLAWERLGLVFAREHWPSMSDLLRGLSRPVAGRWLLLALWIWLGWHLFVRGWHPLLRGSPPSGGSPAVLSFGQIVRHVVVPLGMAYAAVLTTMAIRWQSVIRGGMRVKEVAVTDDGRPGVVMLVRRFALTMAAGHVGF